MGLLQLLLPDLCWLRNYNKKLFRADAFAGIGTALLTLPQGVALAALAGLPPEYGLYSSVIPVIIASLWGSSWHALSGPNLIVSLMMVTILLMFANISTEHYIALSLTLALMTGLIQLGTGTLRLGYLLDYISPTVITGVINAVGILIISSAVWGYIGYYTPHADPFIVKVWHFFHEIFLADWHAFAIGSATLVTGLALKKIFTRFWLVFAMAAGIIVTAILEYLVGLGNTRVEFLGNVNIDWIQFSTPVIIFEDFYIFRQLLVGAFAIALVGMIQAGIVARAMAAQSGQHIDVNKEIVGQGMHNIAASFLSGIAGATSVNRTTVHINSGAKTPMAAILASIFLLIVLVYAAHWIAFLPIPVVSGALILVGLGVINWQAFNFRNRPASESWIYYTAFLTGLISGIVDAVLFGVVVSIIAYLKTSTPLQYYEERKKEGLHLSFTGNLYFGSVTPLKGLFKKLANEPQLQLNFNKLGYLDSSVVSLIHMESEKRKMGGSTLQVNATGIHNMQLQAAGVNLSS